MKSYPKIVAAGFMPAQSSATRRLAEGEGLSS